MRFVSVAALSALGLLASACQQPTGAPPSPGATQPPSTSQPDIAPLTAEGWGLLRVGMTVDQITEAMGPDAEPDDVGSPDPSACDIYRPERAPDGLLVMVLDGKLSRVSIIPPSTLRTDRGFGLASSPNEIKAAYGDAAVVTPHKYMGPVGEDIIVWNGGPPNVEFVQDPAARGVRYETDDQGRVTQIHGGDASIQMVEGCS